MKTWPTLYKKTSTGAIQKWTIAVRGHPDWAPAVAIYTWYGQINGKVQETFDIIKEGKNIGKKNETTPEQQGIAEAQAKWERQKKKGYVDNIADAEDERIDEIIEGGVIPMLAHKFTDHAHKIIYPAWTQPKLDGIRCIAILRDGKCTLWSRTRKQITSMPHIAAEIERNFPENIILDGELYNHAFRNDFEKIVSAVRKEAAEDGYLNVQYHVYDLVNDTTFEQRIGDLSRLYFLHNLFSPHIKLVDTLKVENEDEVAAHFDLFRSQGYEGAILRNSKGYYVNKRSYDLQKVKEFDDAEFEIIGIEEGRGKLAGHVGAFVCRMDNGNEFLAKMSGDTSKLAEYFQHPNRVVGKKLTVKYQGFTGTNEVPRFPVGISIRDYE